MEVKNKTIVITGGGGGMGREMVLQLVRKGARVAAVDINNEALNETVRIAGEHSFQISTYVLDVTDRIAVQNTISTMLKELDSIDGLINNAGIIQPFVGVNELEYDKIERVININFWGALHMTKALLPHLLTHNEAHIVNVSSMGGFMPFPTQTIYGVSKAAIKMLTEGLYSELKDTAVKVTVVFPGAINTNITQNSGLGGPENNEELAKENKALSPSIAAMKIIQAMEKNKFRATIGKDSRMLDKLYRLAPKFATNFVGKMMKKQIDFQKSK